MLKLAYKSLLLFLLVLSCAILLNKLIVLPFYWGNQQLAAKHLSLKEQSIQPSAYFIGSSITYHGVIPAFFSELVQEPSNYAFNLGIDGAQPPQTFYILEALLKEQKEIDYIFFEMNSFDQMADRLSKATRSKYYYRLDHLWMSVNYFAASNYLEKAGLRITHKLGLMAKHGRTFLENMFKIGMRKEVIQGLTNTIPNTTSANKDSNGYFPLLAKEKTGEKAINNLKAQLDISRNNFIAAYSQEMSQVKYNPILQQKFLDFISQAKAKNTKLIFLFTPFECAFDNVSEMKTLFESLPTAHKIDLANPIKYPAFYEVANRWDIGHLNDVGAQLYTQALSDEMVYLSVKQTDYVSRTDSFVVAEIDKKPSLVEEKINLVPKVKTRIKYQINGTIREEKTERNVIGNVNVYVNGQLTAVTENGQFAFELMNKVIKGDKMNIRFSGIDYVPLEQIIDFNKHTKIDLKILLTSLQKVAIATNPMATTEVNETFADSVDYLLPTILENRAAFVPFSFDPPLPKMTFIEGDTFLMDDVLGDSINADEQAHAILLNSYYLGMYEVTYEAYDRFLEATKRSLYNDYVRERGKQPITDVNWYQAIEYCNWLSEEHGYEPVYTIDKTTLDETNLNESDTLKWTIAPNWVANGYRLPTETEWEFAAQQGGQNWSSNVSEWCWDWFGDYNTTTTEFAPTGIKTGSLRVTRTGDFTNNKEATWTSSRIGMPAYKQGIVGFRLCRGMN